MKIKQKVAITHIAKKAWKDVSTVSLALHDSPKLPAKTKRAILKIARELGYRPNNRISDISEQNLMQSLCLQVKELCGKKDISLR